MALGLLGDVTKEGDERKPRLAGAILPRMNAQRARAKADSRLHAGDRVPQLGLRLLVGPGQWASVIRAEVGDLHLGPFRLPLDLGELRLGGDRREVRLGSEKVDLLEAGVGDDLQRLPYWALAQRDRARREPREVHRRRSL